MKILAALVFSLTATPLLGQTSTDRILSLRVESNAAIARHDPEAVVSFFDADYQLTAGSGTFYQDRSAEVSGWAEEFARADDLVYVRTPESIEVASSGRRAAEFGSWVGSWTTAEGPERRAGRYAAHWRNVDGSWKIRAGLFVTLSCEGAECSR